MLDFIGKSILTHRKALGWTQEELAEELDVSATAVSKWERGVSVPELEMVCKLADCFRISVDELIGRKNCLLAEEEKYNDNAMKEFDHITRTSLIEKYDQKPYIVDVMENMAELDDHTIQLIIRELNNTTLMYALAGASGKVCKRFMKNLSGRMLSFVDKHLLTAEFPAKKIEEAQNAVLQIYSIVREHCHLEA